jgi:hypothetical protein
MVCSAAAQDNLSAIQQKPSFDSVSVTRAQCLCLFFFTGHHSTSQNNAPYLLEVVRVVDLCLQKAAHSKLNNACKNPICFRPSLYHHDNSRSGHAL